jgi:hypothetical protein
MPPGIPASRYAKAAAPALHSFGYTRRSLSFFPVFLSSSVVFFAYLCVCQMGAGPLEPMNNAAELIIRQTVLDRVVTQGSCGIRGNEWHEHFWTVLTTCSLQNVSIMDYLKNCLSMYFGISPSSNCINLVS